MPSRRVATTLVVSYTTVSAFPFTPCDAGGSLLFCGAFRRITPPGRLPASRPLEPGLSSRVLQAAHRATVWPTQQCKSVAHRCRRQWHNTSVRHDKPRTTPCSTIGLSMGNVVSRDATALRTPPSTRCVPASSPRRDVGIFSCTDNQIACVQHGQHRVSRHQMQKGTRPLRTDPLKQVIVKPIYSASVSSSFFSEGSGVTSISTPRVSAADFMDREIRRRSRSISMTLT